MTSTTTALPLEGFPLIIIAVDLFCGLGGITTGIENAQYMSQKCAQVVAAINHDEFAIKTHKKNHQNTIHFREDIRNMNLDKLFTAVMGAKMHYEKLGYKVIVLLHASMECTNFSNAKGGMSREADSRSLANFMPLYIDCLNPDYFTVENVMEFKSWGPLIQKKDKKGQPVFRKVWVKEYVLNKKGQPKIKRNGEPCMRQIYDRNGHKCFTMEPHMEPENRTKGEDFWKWVCHIVGKDYNYKDMKLDAADYGEYTSRKRYFAIFAKEGMPLVFPKPTHAKKPKPGSVIKKWLPVKDVLDFEDEGNSIFNRENNQALRKQDRKRLKDTTLARYYAGLIKFVANGEKDFLVKNYSGSPEDKDSQSVVFITQNNSGDPKSKLVDINGPARTITASGGKQNITFISSYYSGSDEHRNHSVDEPAGTVPTENRFAKVSIDFLARYNGNGHNMRSTSEPSGSIACGDNMAKMSCYFIDEQYGNSLGTSIDNPCNALATNPKQSLLTIRNRNWIDLQFSNGKQNQDIDKPLGGITTVPKDRLMTAKFIVNGNSSTSPSTGLDKPAPAITSRFHRLISPRFIVPGNFNNGPVGLDESCPTLLASRHHHYLINPQWNSETALSVENPCFTLIARMDKAPPYIASVKSGIMPLGIVYANEPVDKDYRHTAINEDGEVFIVIYEHDSHYTKLIKEFMAAYGIIDIKMRMLKVPELLKIQGFPDDYELVGSETKQKWMIGNAQPPKIPQRMIEALFEALVKTEENKLAIAA